MVKYIDKLTGFKCKPSTILPNNILNALEEFLKLSQHERTSFVYKKTCVERYGESYFKEHGDKSKQTKIKKYGEDQGKIFMKKAKEAARLKHGDNYQSKFVNADKIKQTKIKIYGDNYASKIAQKAIKTKIERYGENFFKEMGTINYQNFLKKGGEEAVQKKIEKHNHTCIERFGENYLQKFVEFRRKTYIDRYGEGYGRLFFERGVPTKLERYGTIIPNSHISTFEQEIFDFVKSVYNGNIIQSDHSQLNYLELDVFIPDKKFAIEANGWFFHSESSGKWIDKFDVDSIELNYNKYRHLEKTEMCEERNIRLLHITDLEWNDLRKQSIFKSMIKSALGIYDRKIYARKCEFKEIFDKQQIYQILENNHIQGRCNFNRAFGLFYDSELVQCMTFLNHSNHNYNEVELNRMVTLKNTQVIGGFSKLISNSSKLLNTEYITSYIDRGMFDVKGYINSGFEIIKYNEPSYSYIFQNKIYRREFGMRKNIEKLYDEGVLSYWNPDETERVNMWKNDIPRIYNSGTIKVRYKVNK